MANLLGASTSFWSSFFCNYAFCGRRCCKISICIREGDDSPTPTLWNFLFSPTFLPPLVLGNSLSNSCWINGYWLSSISPFTMFVKSINDFPISFGTFSLFMIPFKREMHWSSTVFTVFTNWLFGRFSSRVRLQFH